MENFVSGICEILEVDSVELSDELESFDIWDSLTNLAVLAFCSSEYGISLSAEEIEDAITIGGLKTLIESRL